MPECITEVALHSPHPHFPQLPKKFLGPTPKTMSPSPFSKKIRVQKIWDRKKLNFFKKNSNLFHVVNLQILTLTLFLSNITILRLHEGMGRKMVENSLLGPFLAEFFSTHRQLGYAMLRLGCPPFGLNPGEAPARRPKFIIFKKLENLSVPKISHSLPPTKWGPLR